MKSLAFFSAFTALGTSLVVYACSANDSALDGFANGNGGNGSGASASTGNGGAGGSGTTTGTGTSKGGTTGVTVNTNAPLDPDASCGTKDQPAQLTPIYMVFEYDKSGSMGDDTVTAAEAADANPDNDVPLWQNMATRWTPMKQGMQDFFANAKTSGIQASLKFFPAPGDKAGTCHADYSNASMVPLDAPESLIAALDSQTPQGATPTLPAVLGGIAAARKVMVNNPGSKAVVVLVTDGLPAVYNPATGATETDCAPLSNPAGLTNTIDDIVRAVSAAKKEDPPVFTYVIGIGEATSDMDAIAFAGGTTKMINLNPPPGGTVDPAKTRNDLTAALNGIRTTQFPCSVPLPTTFDANRHLGSVNVSFKHSNGTVEPYKKSADCSQAGWYFDVPASPKSVKLCPDLCTSIQKDLAGTVQISLECPTQLF